VRGNLAALAELGTTKNYTYDQIERLTVVARQQSGQATATPAESYSYDAEGNRTASQSEGAVPQTYVTDAANRVLDDGVIEALASGKTPTPGCRRTRRADAVWASEAPLKRHAHAEGGRARADVRVGLRGALQPDAAQRRQRRGRWLWLRVRSHEPHRDH
jgi:hypothetical protein